MVSTWVPEVSPVAAAVMVGVPATVSAYQAVTDCWLAGKVTLVTDVPPEVVANFLPDDDDERLTVMAEAFVVGLPKPSSSFTVNPLVADELAVLLKLLDVMTSCVPTPALMVSICVSWVSPVAVAVMVGVPATVSPYQAVTDWLPASNCTLVTDAPPEVAANFLPAEVEARLTVIAEAFVVGLPAASSSVTVKEVVAEALAVALKPLETKSCVPAPGVMLKALVVADVSPLLVA